jgi:hypothetical protein
MPLDPIQDQLDHMKQMLRAGVSSFTFGPTVLADLLDQADTLRDILDHRLAFGVVAVLERLPTREAQEAFLRETLGAEWQEQEAAFTLAAEGYVAAFSRQNGHWTWSVWGEPHRRSDAMDALEENARKRS